MSWEETNFQQEITVDGQRILSIDIGHIWHENEKPKRRKRFQEWDFEISERNEQQQKINEGNIEIGQFDFLAFDYGKQLKNQPDLKMIKSQTDNIIQKQIKRTGWIKETQGLFNPPHIKYFNRNLSQQDFEYLIRLYWLDLINQKLKTQNYEYEITQEEIQQIKPEYDQQGKNINTKENYIKNKLLIEKEYLLQECQKLSEAFQVPKSYKKMKLNLRFNLPVFEEKDVSYLPIIMGPGGSTQKVIEQLSKCRVQIKDNQKQPYLLIESDQKKNLEICQQILVRILKGETISKIAQSFNKNLNTNRELVAIETVLRDYCENCKEEGHKVWACPYKISIENKQQKLSLQDLVKCRLCGSNFHVERDCPWLKYQQEATVDQHSYEFYKYLLDKATKNAELKDNDNDQEQNQGIKFITNG